MKRYTYYILTAILFMAAVAGAKAQTLKITVDKTSGEYDMISYDGSYHVVKGTKVKVSLDVTPPSGRIIIDNNTQWEYDSPVQYRKGDSSLNGPTDEFTLTQDTEIKYKAQYARKIYKLKDRNNNVWVTNGISDYVDVYTDEVTVTFKVYDDPAVTYLNVTPQSKNTYVGAGSIDFQAEYTLSNSNSNKLYSVVFWKFDDDEPFWQEKGTPYTFSPGDENLVGPHTIKAWVTVYAPDGETVWWGDESNAATGSIEVYPNPSSVVDENKLEDNLHVSRNYSYPGQKDVDDNDVKYECSVDLTQVENIDKYKWRYTWSLIKADTNEEIRPNDDDVNTNEDTFTSKATFDNPTKVGKYKVKISVQACNPDDENDPWGNPIEYTTSANANDQNLVKVLPAPTIGEISSSLNKPITYAGGHTVDVTLNVTTNASEVTEYTEKISWKEGADDTYKENTTGNNNTYTFDPINSTSDVDVYAKVSIIGPDGKEWNSSEKIITITVLPKPSSVVDRKKLEDNFHVLRNYSYEGQKVKYKCSVNLSQVENIDKYKWRYTWSLINTQSNVEIRPNDDDVNTNEAEYTSTVTFDNLTVENTRLKSLFRHIILKIKMIYGELLLSIQAKKKMKLWKSFQNPNVNNQMVVIKIRRTMRIICMNTLRIRK